MHLGDRRSSRLGEGGLDLEGELAPVVRWSDCAVGLCFAHGIVEARGPIVRERLNLDVAQKAVHEPAKPLEPAGNVRRRHP